MKLRQSDFDSNLSFEDARDLMDALKYAGWGDPFHRNRFGELVPHKIKTKKGRKIFERQLVLSARAPVIFAAPFIRNKLFNVPDVLDTDLAYFSNFTRSQTLGATQLAGLISGGITCSVIKGVAPHATHAAARAVMRGLEAGPGRGAVGSYLYSEDGKFAFVFWISRDCGPKSSVLLNLDRPGFARVDVYYGGVNPKIAIPLEGCVLPIHGKIFRVGFCAIDLDLGHYDLDHAMRDQTIQSIKAELFAAGTKFAKGKF